MSDRHPGIVPVLGLILTLAVASGADAPRGEPESAPASRAEKAAFARERLRSCELFVVDEPDRRCEFVSEPIAAFENPVSRILDGFLFVWTDRGRPVGVVKSYYNSRNESWGRTFVSLASRPLKMLVADKTLWAPRSPAVSFHRLAGAPAPAAQPAQRLSQMRALARRFQFTDRWGLKGPTDWQLRLLTTPLYRYNVPAEDVADGALFGYVLTTSPEAVLLLEARQTDTGLAWYYAVSRCTRFEIRCALDGKPVASFPRLESWPATEVYFHDPIVMPDYPFKPRPDDGATTR